MYNKCQLHCCSNFIAVRIIFRYPHFKFSILFGKRTGHLNLYTLCSRDGWTYIYFIITHTPPINLYSGLALSSKQNTHAFTNSSLSLSLILDSCNFHIKYALTLAVRKTQLKYTLRYLANKFAIFLIKFCLLLTTS